MTVRPDAEPAGEDRGGSDARMIERCRDEPELLAALFDRHADAVHRYTARRLGAEARAGSWATQP